MAHIQMTDRNPSDLGLMEELTNEELLAINGGSIGALAGGVAGAAGSILSNTFNGKPINWHSAATAGLRGARTGASAGVLGGIGGASLAGVD